MYITKCITGLLCILFLMPIMGFAQNSKIKKANGKFEKLDYIKAIEIYKKVVDKGYGNAELYLKLADAHYFNANYTEAGKWYTKLHELQPENPLEVSYRYGQCLKAMGDYERADAFLVKYYRAIGKDYISSEKYLSQIDGMSERFTMSKIDFNTPYSEYPAFFQKDTLYLVATSEELTINAWTGEPASDIFKWTNGILKKVRGRVNSELNEGPMTITKDGKTMFFTRNDYIDGRVGLDSCKTARLKLYKATKVDGEWGDIQELPLNGSNYSIGHPTLNQDDSKLYFVSDMPHREKIGGTDIYEIELLEDGSFGAPLNMADFNTVGNEMFPYIAADGSFYFSSNGHSGLGGLDVFVAKQNTQGEYSKVYNLGRPINGGYDDFAFMMENGKGYLASNRDGTGDEVYSIQEVTPLKDPNKIILEGIVKDKKTNRILMDAVVSILDDGGNVLRKAITDKNGRYMFPDVDSDSASFFRIEHEGHLVKEESLTTFDTDTLQKEVLLDPSEIPVSIGMDIGTLLNTIYFDWDKYDIRPEGELELQKVIAIMIQYPELKIDVRSHTDSRGTHMYNFDLSDRRTAAMIDYLVNNGGIAPSRITGKGYGETQLFLEKCDNGIRCSEQEHRLNRRSEFIIIEK